MRKLNNEAVKLIEINHLKSTKRKRRRLKTSLKARESQKEVHVREKYRNIWKNVGQTFSKFDGRY